MSTDPLPYRSVFDGYQKFNEQVLTPWAQSIATVEQIGGWRVYLKEAQQAQKVQAVTPTKTDQAPQPPRAAGGHAGHGAQP